MRWAVALLLTAGVLPAQPRLLKAASGPSGRVTDGKFRFDEIRSRFVYPRDRQLVVTFEWEGAPGRRQITGVWKDPNGKAVQISDVVVDSPAPQFSAYWTFTLNAEMTPGIWELQARVDGVPAGSHPFEVVVPPPPSATAPLSAEPAARMPLGADRMFLLRQSLVWIHKLDRQFRRTHRYSGFVSAPGQVTTAFQAIDSCAAVAVEFADGSVVQVDRLLAWNRLQDWAILPVETASNVPLVRAAPGPVKVGEDAMLFDAEGQARVLGNAGQIGTSQLPPFGERILIQPQPRPASAGGPLLNAFGEVTGILGGSQLPGLPVSERNVTLRDAAGCFAPVRRLNGPRPADAPG